MFQHFMGAHQRYRFRHLLSVRLGLTMIDFFNYFLHGLSPVVHWFYISELLRNWMISLFFSFFKSFYTLYNILPAVDVAMPLTLSHNNDRINYNYGPMKKEEVGRF